LTYDDLLVILAGADLTALERTPVDTATQLADDSTVIQRVLDHVDNKTTDLADATLAGADRALPLARALRR